MEIIRELLTVGKPTRIGHIYTQEIVDDIIEQLNPDTVCGLGIENAHPPLETAEEHASHKVTELFVENDKLMARIVLLDTPMGMLLQKSISEDTDIISFHLAGLGMINEDETVHDFQLYQVYAEYGGRRKEAQPD
jgi:hypothetical protein